MIKCKILYLIVCRNWLGSQANYFTESFSCTHEIGTEKDAINSDVFKVFFTRCIIGNTIGNRSLLIL